MQTNFPSLVGLFRHIVDCHPDRIALQDAEKSVTYSSLYRYASRLAQLLRSKGIRSGMRVVCISRKNVESIICFWGILLNGSIAVMFDQEDGIESNRVKLKSVMADAVILDSDGQPATNTFLDIPVFDLKEAMMELPVPSTPENNTSPSDICYILMTSGTTGVPKAIQISHGSILHYTYSIYEKIGKPQFVNAAHVSTFAADLGLTNLVVALISGGMLRILNKVEASDPVIFSGIINKSKISLLKITPSHLSSLVSGKSQPFISPIDTVILGGEKLGWSLVKDIVSSGIAVSVYNHYGPTETTVGALVFPIDISSIHFENTASVPIGSPLGEGICFIENEKEGIGELFIGGPGISAGYLKNETENSKRFLQKLVDGKNITCYRTGDICKRLKDGRFEFLYRLDRQVKVKGYRIELGEIELVISHHPDIDHVIVDLAADGLNTTLEAFIRTRNGKELTKDSVRSWLAGRIEPHKIPSYIHFYQDIQYNSNGKIDLASLRKLSGRNEEYFPVSFDDNIKEGWSTVCEFAWKEILRKNIIDPADNFFEIGGDSLLAIQLIGKLQRLGYRIHIVDLNKHPVFSEFSSLQPPKLINPDNFLVAGNEVVQQLTLSQHMFMQQERFERDNYCQIVLLETEDNIQLREMALAINHVVRNHSQLTTVFRKRGESFETEKIKGLEVGVGASVLDKNTSTMLQIQEVNKKLMRDISISRGRLFIAHVFVDPAGPDYLQLICHHLAVDVISWNIIIEEILECYDQLLKAIEPRMAVENARDEFFRKIKENDSFGHFSEIYSGENIYTLPVSNQLNDPCRDVNVIGIVMDEKMSSLLHKLDDPRKEVGLNGLLLSALSEAICKTYLLNKISIDVEFHSRPQDERLPDLSRSIGWWSTTIPLTIQKDYASPESCTTLINNKAAICNTLNCFNPDVTVKRDTIPDIRLNYLGHFPDKFGSASIQLKPSRFNPGATRSEAAEQEYKLFFTCRSVGNSMIIDVQYQSRHLTAPVINTIIDTFISIVRSFLEKENNEGSLPHPQVFQSNMPSVGQPLYTLVNNHLNGRKTIFLTGATGFLGIHVLKELVENDHNIYCLVRDKTEAGAKKRLLETYEYYFPGQYREKQGQLKVVCGDMLQKNLGLTEKQYQQIASESDLIIHAAADINLIKDYNDLVKINSNPINDILELALKGKSKELHYVSTLAVSGYSPNNGHSYFSENNFEYGQSFVSGYEQTKYEAEKIVREFFSKGGKGKIYRIGHIAADSICARFQRNIHQNRLFQVIKGAILLGKVPVNYSEKISFSYVDVVAKGIVNIALEKIKSDMECIHLENSEYVDFRKVIRIITRLGYNIEITGMEEYRQAMEEFRGTDPDKQALILMDTWIRRSMDFPRNTHYVQKKSLDLIAQTGLYFPKLNSRWLSRMMQEGVKANYFPSLSTIKFSAPIFEEEYE